MIDMWVAHFTLKCAIDTKNDRFTSGAHERKIQYSIAQYLSNDGWIIGSKSESFSLKTVLVCVFMCVQ